MDEGVDALSDEMEAIGLLAVVEALEILDPLEKKSVGERKLFRVDFALVHDPDSDHELTVVSIIWLRKYLIK